MAWIVPLFKKGSRLLPENSRLISLTCISCKILKLILLIHSIISGRPDVTDIVTDILTIRQHGFHAQRSCGTQLISAIDYLAKRFERRESMDGLSLYFEKAFDCISHRLILFKRNTYSINLTVLKWIEKPL